MDRQLFEKLKNEVDTNKNYDFLRNDPHLGKNLIVVGLGGSYAYGTHREGSDIDVRGVALNSANDIALMNDFEQVVINNDVVDATLYSFDKMLDLLAKNNPNTLEILGLDDTQIFYKSPIWDEVVAISDAFLSKRVISTFGGYANAQLRRLENKSARVADQARREQHVFDSINHAAVDFKTRYDRIYDDELKLYIDKSAKPDMDSEIFVDINLKHYPLRDLANVMNDYHSVIRDYDKIGKRNEKAIAHDKLGKHMMHLVRLYYMCFDILEKGIIKTFRDEEHDELMAIRYGKYLDENKQVIPAFYSFIDGLEDRLKKLSASTSLPDLPDYDRINALRSSVNQRIIRGEI